MKTISTLILVLSCSVCFAQHPLSTQKGANAKNYKASKDVNLKPTTVQLFETPSDKYYAGANAKNNFAKEDASKFTPTGSNKFVRGKGANAKNRHLIIHKNKAKKEAEIQPKESIQKDQISR